MPQLKKKTREYIKFFIDCQNALLCSRPVNELELRKVFNELTKLLKTGKRDPEVYSALGMYSCIKKDVKKSKEYHQASVDMAKHPYFYRNFAISMCHLKDMKEAMKNCKKAIELDPLDVEIRTILIRILECEGKIEEAKAYTKELLEGKFKGNDELIDKYDDLLDYEIMPELIKRANDPPDKFIPLEQAISEL